MMKFIFQIYSECFRFLNFLSREMHRRLFSVVSRCAWKQRRVSQGTLFDTIWCASCQCKQKKSFIKIISFPCKCYNFIRVRSGLSIMNNNKMFCFVLCKKGVSLKTLPASVESVLVRVSCTALGLMSRLLWKERFIGPCGWSESTNDLAHGYLKM